MGNMFPLALFCVTASTSWRKNGDLTSDTSTGGTSTGISESDSSDTEKFAELAKKLKIKITETVETKPKYEPEITSHSSHERFHSEPGFTMQTPPKWKIESLKLLCCSRTKRQSCRPCMNSAEDD